MSDEEEEGVIGDEGDWAHRSAAQVHDGAGGGGRLRSLLIDVHKGLVDHL